MSSPHPKLPPRRRAEYGFRPRFTLAIVYLLASFVIFALLFTLPELMDILESVPPGPEQQTLAEEAVREALAGKVYFALAGSVVVVAAGAYFQVLPGLRPD